MTIEEFFENYYGSFKNYYGSLCSLEEVAKVLREIDDEDLRACACNYLDAQENLEIMLDEIGFKFG